MILDDVDRKLGYSSLDKLLKYQRSKIFFETYVHRKILRTAKYETKPYLFGLWNRRVIVETKIENFDDGFERVWWVGFASIFLVAGIIGAITAFCNAF